MIRSAVTVSLVNEARGGPFVFWDDLPQACEQAATLGFEGVELFFPSADHVSVEVLSRLFQDHHLKLAAMGTGAGWVKHQLSLTDANAEVRKQAVAFIKTIIERASAFQAPAIIGSMQGRFSGTVNHATAIAYLQEGLLTLGQYAAALGTQLLYEPLNRYETNLCHTLRQGVELIRPLECSNIKLLADLFHMNIEEEDIAAALRSNAQHVGHIHFADSNRRPVGCGHTEMASIAQTITEMDYSGYISAEVLPWPTSHEAAKSTINAFRKYF